jgi:hypothetical protein
MDNGVKISVYDVNGFSSEMVYDGKPGVDGTSPVAKVEQGKQLGKAGVELPIVKGIPRL